MIADSILRKKQLKLAVNFIFPAQAEERENIQIYDFLRPYFEKISTESNKLSINIIA